MYVQEKRVFSLRKQCLGNRVITVISAMACVIKGFFIILIATELKLSIERERLGTGTGTGTIEGKRKLFSRFNVREKYARPLNNTMTNDDGSRFDNLVLSYFQFNILKDTSNVESTCLVAETCMYWYKIKTQS